VIALDASVLIGHLMPHDAHHAAATEILSNAAPGSMLVHPLTLAACSSAVDGSDAARRCVMTCCCSIPVAAPDAGEPLRLAERRVSTCLKLPDWYALDVAPRTASSLATFDDALAAGARRRGVALLP
jgi:predicted nucleic acid-binding protein